MRADLLRRGVIISALIALCILQRSGRLSRVLAMAQQGQAIPDISGTWTQQSNNWGSRGRLISIGQAGTRLTIVNEWGETWTGAFTSPTEFTIHTDMLRGGGSGDATADLTNLVGACYTEITMANGSDWTRPVPAGGCATAVTVGAAQVWTLNDAGTQNPPQYHLFDDIQYCFSTPSLGATVLTDLAPDGSSTVLYQQGGDATSQCLTGFVLDVVGQECLQLAFTPVQDGISGSTQTVQTCWQDLP